MTRPHPKPVQFKPSQLKLKPASLGTSPAAQKSDAAQESGQKIAVPNNIPSSIQKLLAIEGEAFNAVDRLSLKHIAVNRPRTLLPLGHILWVSRSGDHFSFAAISSQSVFDKTTPFAQWIHNQVDQQIRAKALDTALAFTFTRESFPNRKGRHKNWNETKPAKGGGPKNKSENKNVDNGDENGSEDGGFDYPFPHAFYAPFGPDSKSGGLLFTREAEFGEKDHIIMVRLGQIFGTCWAALGRKKRNKLTPRKRTLWVGTLLVLLICACIPVSMTELAQAEIVANDPFIVTAPIDGVIEDMLVAPNMQVEAGTILARLNDVSYRNELKLAREDKSLSEARLRQAALTSFIDESAKRDIAVAQAEIDLSDARRSYAEDRLAKTTLVAPRAGLVIYSDPQDWMGRPVTTGEAIMQIADPEQIILRIQAPLTSGESLQMDARIRVFMDSNPLNPIEATLERAAFYAEEQANGQMAYIAYARLETDDQLPRIGTQGVAKIYGAKAPFGYWLLRRPLTALRQFTGL